MFRLGDCRPYFLRYPQTGNYAVAFSQHIAMLIQRYELCISFICPFLFRSRNLSISFSFGHPCFSPSSLKQLQCGTNNNRNNSSLQMSFKCSCLAAFSLVTAPNELNCQQTNKQTEVDVVDFLRWLAIVECVLPVVFMGYFEI